MTLDNINNEIRYIYNDLLGIKKKLINIEKK